MINGWIITGFPKNAEQMEKLNSELSLYPSLVIVLKLEKDYIIKKSASRRLDPSSGKVYYTDAKDFNNALLSKLVIKNEDKPEVLKKRLENWQSMETELEKPNCSYKTILKILNGDTPLNQLIELISDSMINSA